MMTNVLVHDMVAIYFHTGRARQCRILIESNQNLLAERWIRELETWVWGHDDAHAAKRQVKFGRKW